MYWENTHLVSLQDKKKHLVTPLFSFRMKKNGREYWAVFFWERYELEFLVIDTKKEVYHHIKEQDYTRVYQYWMNKFGLTVMFDRRTKKLSVYKPVKDFRYKRRNYEVCQEIILDGDEASTSKFISFFRIIHHRKKPDWATVNEIKDRNEIIDLMFHYLDLTD